MQPKLCQIIDEDGKYQESVVWVDQCSDANFISRQKLEALRLQASPTASRTFQTIMGDVQCGLMINLTWKGSHMASVGESTFYVLPERSNIPGIIAGKALLNRYGSDIFADAAPALVTVAAPMSVSA